MADEAHPYCHPEVVAMRRRSGVSLCVDDDCRLSGGYAHVGLCEPCSCGLEHAVEECPVNWPRVFWARL